MTRIYDRPDLDQGQRLPPLFVTGAFVDAKPGEPYEGRLQIHNGVGGMTVTQVDGDRLPNGSGLYIEGDEVVLNWPAYSETASVIPNPGFEAGDVNWQKGPGWSIGPENPITGIRSARYGETQGSSIISNTARYPVNPGRPITASCNVRQGASAEGNAGAAVQLEWRSPDGSLLSASEGNAVMSASKNRVYPSTVQAMPPAGAALVNVASRGIRNRENKALFVDDFQWDHTQLTGVNVDVTYQLTLIVRDAAGRSFLWIGSVRVRAIDPTTPVVLGIVDTTRQASTTLHLVSLPPNIRAGDLLLMSIVINNGTGPLVTMSAPPGWTLVGQAGSNTYFKAAMLMRVADGTEGDSVTVTSASVAVSMAAQVWRIAAGTYNADVSASVGSFDLNTQIAAGSTSNIGYTQHRTLMIGFCGASANTLPTTWPAADNQRNVSVGTTTQAASNACSLLAQFTGPSASFSATNWFFGSSRMLVSGYCAVRGRLPIGS